MPSKTFEVTVLYRLVKRGANSAACIADGLQHARGSNALRVAESIEFSISDERLRVVSNLKGFDVQLNIQSDGVASV